MAKKSNLKQLKELTTINEASILQDMSMKASIDDQMQFANEAWTLSNTHVNKKPRAEHIISLHLMWISVKTILEQVNKIASVKWWWKLDSETAVKWIIARHFQNYEKPVDLEMNEHLEGIKQWMYAQQENIIEKASVFVADKKKKWTPFEYMWALKELYAMRQQMIENRNWNDSRKNIHAGEVNITNQLNVFVDNSRKIAFWQVENPALDALKAKLDNKFNKKNTNE